MSALIAKIRKAREKTVEVGGFTFTVRRPTDIEMLGYADRRADVFLDHVIGWAGVKELDIIPGGDPHPVPFDAAVCREWLSDQPDIAGAVIGEVVALYESHVAALAEAKKN